MAAILFALANGCNVCITHVVGHLSMLSAQQRNSCRQQRVDGTAHDGTFAGMPSLPGVLPEERASMSVPSPFYIGVLFIFFTTGRLNIIIAVTFIYIFIIILIVIIIAVTTSTIISITIVILASIIILILFAFHMLLTFSGLKAKYLNGHRNIQEVECIDESMITGLRLLSLKIYIVPNGTLIGSLNVITGTCLTYMSYASCDVNSETLHASRLSVLVVDLKAGYSEEYVCRKIYINTQGDTLISTLSLLVNGSRKRIQTYIYIISLHMYIASI